MCFARVDAELRDAFQEQLLDTALALETLLDQVARMTNLNDRADALSQIAVVLHITRANVHQAKEKL